MPAYRQRIYICPGEHGRPVLIVDFPLWWDRRAFFENYGARQIDTGNPSYVDYGLLLTSAEANAWDKRCREALAADPHSLTAHTLEAMRSLASALETARWVIVESYEWESGLD
jgi:hypothetical protein